MSNYIYGFTALTGGTTGCLDNIDGSLLSDQDMALGAVLSTGIARIYALNATSGATADGINIVSPATNAGNKRWILQNPTAPGSVVQVVNYSSGTLFTTSAQIPVDNSIPQNTDGAQWATLAITPKSSTNKLIIDVVLQLGMTTYAYQVAAALFQDSTVGALNAVTQYSYTDGGQDNFTLTMKHFMTAGTTSATTFKVNVGSGRNAGSVCVNGNNGSQIFGGKNISSITITEIKV